MIAYVYRRHSLVVRVLHWIMVLSLAVMLTTGLRIFNAHPALYWGQSSYTGKGPFFKVTERRKPSGGVEGVTQIGGHAFDTTALKMVGGLPFARPSSLALARRWHFFFAWVLVLAGLLYVGHAVGSGRLRRELWPTRRDWRGLWPSVVDHLRLRRARGEAARRYNVLQKLSYLALMFALLPAIVVMGLAMSPWLDSVWPGWVDWLGGRQTARALHFIGAWLVVLFVLVHVFEVVVTGLVNNLRSMITGNYHIEAGGEVALRPRPEEADDGSTH